MDIFDPIQECLARIPELARWPQMQGLLEAKIAQKPRTWLLPVMACEAVGGAPEQAAPGAAAIGCMQAAIMLVDDMLDDDPRGEFLRLGAAETANLAAAFQAAGLAAMALAPLDPERRLAALASLNQMALDTALGQHMDIQNVADEEAYWAVVRAKSSPYHAASFYVGALLGGAPPATADAIYRWGALFGEMIQIHDDLNDTLAVPANPDWTHGRSPLPILFAQGVAHPERERFLALRPGVADPAVLTEAQNILLRCGAVSYCADQLLRRHQAAKGALEAMQLARPEVFGDLLDETARPVWAVFSDLGLPQPVPPPAAVAVEMA